MDANEFDEQLSELETRVDRLRALYENWFRGYERQEPSVARKDCDRRVYALRKEMPRSTALRYRYNMLFQRYTTLVSYWQRTSKQIEEGTYRLQLQRLRRKKKEANEEQALELDAAAPNGKKKDDKERPERFSLDLDESFDVRDLLDDRELDAVALAVDRAPVAAEAARPAPAAHPPAPAPQAPSPSRSAATFARPQALNRPGQADPGTATNNGNGSSASNGHAPSASNDNASSIGSVTAPPAPPRAPVPSTPATTQAGLAGLPAPPTVFGPPLKPGAARPPVPPPPPRTPSSEQAVARQGITASGVRLATAAGQPSRPSLPLGPGPAVPPPPPPSSTRGPSQERLKNLYQEYAAARRSNNEGEVRYETLVGSINKMLPELQKKHGGKDIDFEVVLKDGRVGLKPRAK